MLKQKHFCEAKKYNKSDFWDAISEPVAQQPKYREKNYGKEGEKPYYKKTYNNDNRGDYKKREGGNNYNNQNRGENRGGNYRNYNEKEQRTDYRKME